MSKEDQPNMRYEFYSEPGEMNLRIVEGHGAVLVTWTNQGDITRGLEPRRMEHVLAEVLPCELQSWAEDVLVWCDKEERDGRGPVLDGQAMDLLERVWRALDPPAPLDREAAEERRREELLLAREIHAFLTRTDRIRQRPPGHGARRRGISGARWSRSGEG